MLSFMNFNEEERCLIQMYSGANPSRRTVLDAINGVRRFIGDIDMRDLVDRTVKKIEGMSEGEFRTAYMGAVTV